jgi:hypothetical protein
VTKPKAKPRPVVGKPVSVKRADPTTGPATLRRARPRIAAVSSVTPPAGADEGNAFSSPAQLLLAVGIGLLGIGLLPARAVHAPRSAVVALDRSRLYLLTAGFFVVCGVFMTTAFAS